MNGALTVLTRDREIEKCTNWMSKVRNPRGHHGVHSGAVVHPGARAVIMCYELSVSG